MSEFGGLQKHEKTQHALKSHNNQPVNCGLYIYILYIYIYIYNLDKNVKMEEQKQKKTINVLGQSHPFSNIYI